MQRASLNRTGAALLRTWTLIILGAAWAAAGEAEAGKKAAEGGKEPARSVFGGPRLDREDRRTA